MVEIEHNGVVAVGAADSMQRLLICDLRADWSGMPYITFWRPNNANYAYPLAWAGDYTSDVVDAQANYYTAQDDGVLIRFAVPRDIAEALGVDPKPGLIDGDVGPVVPNTATTQKTLRAAAYVPAVLRKSLGASQ